MLTATKHARNVSQFDTQPSRLEVKYREVIPFNQ